VITLSISLPDPGSPWLRTWDDVRDKDPATLSEMDLRYKYFGVDFRLAVGGIEITPQGQVVTLVDLMFSLLFALERISSGQDGAFGFTENDDVIHLRQESDSVIVSSSKGSVEGSVNREEFLGETVRFLSECFSRLVAEVPELSVNPTIQRLRLE